ncbi:MAG: Gfo/Idh/MocA family oxidoreductase [Acidimicrobiia bacterium]|nr:Gfo/Idh/MocA family oxidoreductase [Acidimicrobiia bacterium]
MTDQLRAGIVGSGWMALVHTEALRRIGVEVVGMVGSTPERARAKAANPLLPPAVDSLDELLAIPGLSAVHVTSPNHVHAEQAAAALRAGVPVVCEKPLGVDSAETGRLEALAAETGLVNAVCFNLRHYPQNQNAAALVAAGEIGDPRFVTGSYLQDWLLLDTDWNWRLDASRQGSLRAVADIGSHWLDLTRFVIGRRVTAVFADLHTFITERNRPVGEVETFGASRVDRDAARVVEPMASDDAAGLLLRFEGGARGTASISQISAGRKNSTSWEIDGATSALAWTSEDPDRLWWGHRGRPNEVVEKDAATLTAVGAATANLPGGHVEGYADTFRAMFTAVYRDIAAGAPSARPDYPTFADGHDAVLVCEAVSASAARGTWAEVRREATTTTIQEEATR